MEFREGGGPTEIKKPNSGGHELSDPRSREPAQAILGELLQWTGGEEVGYGKIHDQERCYISWELGLNQKS